MKRSQTWKPFRYAHAEIRTQVVVICGPTLYQLDDEGALSENEKKYQSSQETEVYPLAFSELVTLVDSQTKSKAPAIYWLQDIANLYKQQLEQLEVKQWEVNSTRLKSRQLAEIPKVEAHKREIDILLVFNINVPSAW